MSDIVACRVLKSGKCYITQKYWSGHKGMDITDCQGGAHTLGYIVAHSAGKVTSIRNNCTGFEQGSYGNYVLIQHENGYYTMYAHLAYNTVTVKAGQTVKKGQVIGYMGNTGYSFGGHLHWEVRDPNGKIIDNTDYLNADLPKVNVVNVVYQVFDDVTKSWLPNVINDKDYAGTFGHDIDCVYCNLNKSAIYTRVHTWKGDSQEQYKTSKWLSSVKNREKYSGVKGQPIDAVMFYISDTTRKKYNIDCVEYRVHLRKSKQWLDWCKDTKHSIKDPNNGYAGEIGKPIDAIQIRIKYK